jgi:hypothetical protein
MTDRDTSLHRIVYYSRVEAPMARDALAELVQRAAQHNFGKQITGGLALVDGWFVQVLEGPRAEVAALYGRIARDPRHTHVTTVQDEPIEARQFAGVWMGLAQDPAISPLVRATWLTAAAFEPSRFSGDQLSDFVRAACREAELQFSQDQKFG